LPDKKWTTPSLCADWSVRDVVAHMTATAEMTPASFFPKLAGAGFSFTKMSNKEIAKRVTGSPSQTLEHFASRARSRKHPPGPVESWLGETIVHAEDVRRPLGVRHDYDAAALARVAEFYRRSNLILGGRKRVAGLTMRASDADWTAGSGPEVSGPLVSLVLATAGRKQALDDLSGPGVEILRSRD
jgi:uncharacterized protein (TIGR03083 family)